MKDEIIKEWIVAAGLLNPGLRVRRFSLYRELKVSISRLLRKRAVELVWSYDGNDLVYVSHRIYALVQKYK